MPGMNGPEAAQRLHEIRPDLKVLFMSSLLVKPFSLEALGRKVHEILDCRSRFSRPPQPPR